MRRVWAAIVRWALHHEGSTRSAALIRIGLALALWARFGGDLGLFVQSSAAGRTLALVFWIASTCMLIGLGAWLASAITAACVLAMCSAWPALGGNEGWAHHHVQLLGAATLFCALTPCGRSYSLDRWRALRRAAASGAPAPAERGNLWGLRLIVLQLSVIYLFAAIDKTHLGFLSGARLEHYLLWYYWGSDAPAWPGFHALLALVAVANVALEYALALGLPWPRTRRWLLLPGLGLHVLFYLLLPVATYSATVMLLYLAYLDPERVHAVLDELGG